MAEQAEASGRPRTLVYLGLSVDGYIARAGGEIDFLETVEPTDEDLGDLGFSDFMATVDSMVMGRNTFDLVVDAGFDWMYGDTPVLVWTSRELSLPADFPGVVEAISGEPTSILEELAARGLRSVYIDGGMVVRSFLAQGLVDELTLTRLPVMIGTGITLFTELAEDLRLHHAETIVYSNGLVKTHYITIRD